MANLIHFDTLADDEGLSLPRPLSDPQMFSTRRRVLSKANMCDFAFTGKEEGVEERQFDLSCLLS